MANTKKPKEKFDVSKNRACSYNPLDNLIETTETDANGVSKTSTFLPAAARKDWFITYCRENNIVGVIDESHFEIIPQINMLVIIATVYMDDKVVANGIAGSFITDGCSPTIMQSTATAAVRRALGNAGFAITADSADDPDLPTPGGFTPTPFTMFDRGEGYTPVPSQPVVSQSPVPTIVAPKTVDEAKKLILRVKSANNQHNGRTLGEIAAVDENFLRFIASDNWKGNSVYHDAANMILQDIH